MGAKKRLFVVCRVQESGLLFARGVKGSQAIKRPDRYYKLVEQASVKVGVR